MAHRKEEYDVNGHEVTIQQVNEGGEVSAWIDGYAAHTDKAIESCDNMLIGHLIKRRSEEGEMWGAVTAMVAVMVELDVYFCTKCNSFYDADTVVRTHFAGHKCGECSSSDNHCPDNPDSDKHDFEITNPRHKRNARIATKYKCEHCGYKKRSTPTG